MEKSAIESMVNRDYDLGSVKDVEVLTGGMTNLSYMVRTEGAEGEQVYFVRVYNPAAAESEIRFEHALLTHLHLRGFTIAAGVLPKRDGTTYVRLKDSGEQPVRYAAVFEFCEGEAKYTWYQNRWSAQEAESAARALADLHAAGFDFNPRGLRRVQPPIMEYLALVKARLDDYAARPLNHAFDRYYRSQLTSIRKVLDEALGAAHKARGLPFIPIHCDYYPANMTFLDDRIRGLFDFDWAKIDYRVFDVGHAMVYCFSSHDGADQNHLRFEAATRFLHAYQDQAALKPAPGAMGERELALLPLMVATGNLYLLIWCLDCRYVEGRDEDEYLEYLEHFVAIMEDVQRLQPDLERVSQTAVVAARV